MINIYEEASEHSSPLGLRRSKTAPAGPQNPPLSRFLKRLRLHLCLDGILFDPHAWTEADPWSPSDPDRIALRFPLVGVGGRGSFEPPDANQEEIAGWSAGLNNGGLNGHL
jgi:hypothetical protein